MCHWACVVFFFSFFKWMSSRHKVLSKKVEGSICAERARGIELSTPLVILWSRNQNEWSMLLTKNVTLPFPLVRKELVRDPGAQTNYCSLGWRGDLKTGVGGGPSVCVCAVMSGPSSASAPHWGEEQMCNHRLALVRQDDGRREWNKQRDVFTGG